MTTTPILGPSTIPPIKAVMWTATRGATVEFCRYIIPLYYAIAPAAGVRPEVAICQAAKETGYGWFGGKVRRDFHNWCGLKTRDASGDDPEDHALFPTDEVGIVAHIHHLALYAAAPGFPMANTPDPRHFHWLRGNAVTVEQLGGRWAPAPAYGDSIVWMLSRMDMVGEKG